MVLIVKVTKRFKLSCYLNTNGKELFKKYYWIKKKKTIN